MAEGLKEQFSFQIPAATLIWRRKLHEQGEMFNPQSQEESRYQAERLLSNISETWSSVASMLMTVLTDLTAFQ
jgi:hypothetical protein